MFCCFCVKDSNMETQDEDGEEDELMRTSMTNTVRKVSQTIDCDEEEEGLGAMARRGIGGQQVSMCPVAVSLYPSNVSSSVHKVFKTSV